MKSLHRQYTQSAADMTCIGNCTIDLVVTSPPYPMIEMWDESFIHQDPAIASCLKINDGQAAFTRMHQVLDAVWDEVGRVMKVGGFVCINIGDAVRKLGDDFRLFPNHAYIMDAMIKRGFMSLPGIIWRKQTNAPNKFMGSGMLPAGAYVTLEHEYILVFRKGGKRTFDTDEEKQARRKSAIFWEERNSWFSDVWMDLKGTQQQLADNTVRKRSGSFPFDLPYRLVNMFSVAGDTVLDPFSGIGTTMLAAMACGRNSAGFEIEKHFVSIIGDRVRGIVDLSNRLIASRVERHRLFVSEREKNNKPLKHVHSHYGFPVMTKQETGLLFHPLVSVTPGVGSKMGCNAGFTVHYSPAPTVPVPEKSPVEVDVAQLILPGMR